MVDNYGIMSLESIEELMMRREKLLYLQQHNYKIWQGKNGKWYTYLPGRKLVKRSTLDDLENYISSYYKDQQTNPTIEELFDEWIAYKMELKEIGLGTRDRYNNDFNRFIRGTAFQSLKIRAATTDDIDILIRHTIANNDITSKTFSNLRTVLRGIFRYAKRKKLTDLSITAYFQDLDISKRVFRSNRKNPETAVFSDEEAHKLIQYLYSHPTVENLGIVLAFESGVRVGELAAIKFSDISDGVLHIQRQEIVYKSNEVGHMVSEVVDYTKTEAGNRYIYLPSNSVNILTKLRFENQDSDFIMYKNGHRIGKRLFYEYLVKACQAIDIPPRSMHKIRSTYATKLIDSNVEDSLVMEQMGHTDISTTRKYYYFSNKNDQYKKDKITRAIQY